NNNPSNNRHKSSIGNPRLPLESHQIRKHSREKRRRSTDSLIERHREVPKRDVTTHNRPTKHNAQSRDSQQLRPRFDPLEREDLEEDDGDEDWEAKAIIGEQELVEKKNTNVGRVPEGYE
ncbi:hypothetical protein HYC85_022381, partial [Camellia sinensis]